MRLHKLSRPIKIGTVFIIALLGLASLTLLALIAVPITYYGNMILVIAFQIKPTESEIIGQYRADTQQGSAYLIVNSDHTFTESVRSKTGGVNKIEGKWKQEELDSVGFSTQFSPFTYAYHDKFETYSYGSPVFEKNLRGHIAIEEDPDYGIYFYKVSTNRSAHD